MVYGYFVNYVKGKLTTIIVVSINTLNTRHFYPSAPLFELQVKQPKLLGQFYPFEFTVWYVCILALLCLCPYILYTGVSYLVEREGYYQTVSVTHFSWISR